MWKKKNQNQNQNQKKEKKNISWAAWMMGLCACVRTIFKLDPIMFSQSHHVIRRVGAKYDLYVSITRKIPRFGKLRSSVHVHAGKPIKSNIQTCCRRCEYSFFQFRIDPNMRETERVYRTIFVCNRENFPGCTLWNWFRILILRLRPTATR